MKLPSLPTIGPLIGKQINTVDLFPDIEEATKRVRMVQRWQGTETELIRIPGWSYDHGDPPVIAIMYIFAALEKSGRYNPSVVMSVWKAGEKYMCEFGSQTGAPVDIYFDGVMVDTLNVWKGLLL